MYDAGLYNPDEEEDEVGINFMLLFLHLLLDSIKILIMITIFPFFASLITGLL